ncbi:unnamed protein product [Meganyctiphanes norvegica]|uniref:Chitin-binding type-2 domain-containing protein n=1 Tax=Meganyctiphanes norvegica TaxID=48144 RepID=A0AAV2RTE8_MEGNR
MVSHNFFSCIFLLASTAVCIVVQSTSSLKHQLKDTTLFPTYSSIPDGLSFSCNDRIPGYYADIEAQCQVWHWCHPDGPMYSFLCPNQTMFNQKYRLCDWYYNVDCPGSPDYYNINKDLYEIPQFDYLDNEDQYYDYDVLPSVHSFLPVAPCQIDHVRDNYNDECVSIFLNQIPLIQLMNGFSKIH